MNWFEIGKEIVKVGAPLLGLSIGGPAGASIAYEVAQLFGADPTNPQDILSKIQGDPDAKNKLVQIESEKTIELQKIAFEMTEALYNHEDHENDTEEKDVEDARKMEELTHDWMPKFITIAIILSLISALYLFFVWPIPQQNLSIIIGILVLLGYQFWNCCRFYIGGKVPTLEDMEKLAGK